RWPPAHRTFPFWRQVAQCSARRHEEGRVVEAVGIEPAQPLFTVFRLSTRWPRSFSLYARLAWPRLPRCSCWFRAFRLVLLDGCWMESRLRVGRSGDWTSFEWPASARLVG